MLSELNRLKPDDVKVLEIEFRIAINAKKWNQALKICQLVQDKNLDQAKGRFWFGQLELAQGKYREAIRSFSKGLELREVYSQGHYLFELRLKLVQN